MGLQILQKMYFQIPRQIKFLSLPQGLEESVSASILQSLTKTIINLVQSQQIVFVWLVGCLTIFSFVVYDKEIHSDLFFLQINAFWVDQSQGLRFKVKF